MLAPPLKPIECLSLLSLLHNAIRELMAFEICASEIQSQAHAFRTRHGVNASAVLDCLQDDGYFFEIVDVLTKPGDDELIHLDI